MTTFAWLILTVSGLGAFVLFVSKLPETKELPHSRGRLYVVADSLLSYFWHKLKQLGGLLWRFILEAKDIRPSQAKISEQMDKVKNVFKIRIRSSDKEAKWLPEVTDTISDQPTTGMQKPKTAEDLYLETIKRDPTNKQAYEGLGRLYLQEKNFAEAVEIFRFLTKSDSSRDVYWSNLGISLYSVKDYPGAIAAYERALNINNKIPTRWMNLAMCFEATDEHTRAIKAINKALELDRRNVTYLSALSEIYIKVSNRIRAEEVLSHILTLEPTNKLAREKLMKLRI